MDTDFLTIRKMKQGDEAALDAFVRKYYSDILKYCTFHSSDQREAEDLTQETFVRFFAKLSEYRYQGKTKNYLYTIAANLCRNQWKKLREIADVLEIGLPLVKYRLRQAKIQLSEQLGKEATNHDT